MCVQKLYSDMWINSLEMQIKKIQQIEVKRSRK